MTIRRVVYPGTFDPAHFGHIDIAMRAARTFDEVIVAVYAFPAKKLLFNLDERVSMLERLFHGVTNVRVDRYTGLTVDYVRQVGASAMIRGLRVFSDFELEFRMALANRRLAPEIEVVNFIADEKHLHIKAQTLRLYNPESHQWSIYLVDLDKGTLELPPVVGQFTGNRGEFYNQQQWKGRAVLVRYLWLNISPKSARMEQSFSSDGGKAWETNWICELTR